MFALHLYLRISTVRKGTGNDSNMDIDIFQLTEIFISSNNSTIIFNGNFIVLEINGPNVGEKVAFIVRIPSTVLALDNSETRHKVKSGAHLSKCPSGIW